MNSNINKTIEQIKEQEENFEHLVSCLNEQRDENNGQL